MSQGSCDFQIPSITPYYWDPNCTSGMLGCWADSQHVECRFCGQSPYVGIPCPQDAAVVPDRDACFFEGLPEAPVYWEPDCKPGMQGCNADGKHLACRFCGEGNYSNITCPAKACQFPNEPLVPYYWDPSCRMGVLGCNADGFHVQCRFCAHRPFENITCPWEPPAPGACTFSDPPLQSFTWDPNCAMGILGCWADGFHAQCRFCGGSGAYKDLPC